MPRRNLSFYQPLYPEPTLLNIAGCFLSLFLERPSETYDSSFPPTPTRGQAAVGIQETFGLRQFSKNS